MRAWLTAQEEAKNDLTALLNIFNQSNMTQNDHILEIDETTIPEKYHPILKRLAMIAGDNIMLHEMEVEDDFLAEIDQYLDAIDDERSQKEEERRQKEKALSQKEEERRQKEEERRQKEEALDRNKSTIKYFVAQGMDKDEICEILNMSLVDLEELMR